MIKKVKKIKGSKLTKKRYEECYEFQEGDNSFSNYANVSTKLTFHTYVCVSRGKTLFFRKILRT